LVLKVAKEIKLARSLDRFKCPNGEGGCQNCLPFEKILQGKAIFVGTNDYGADLYVSDNNVTADLTASEIL
jgi:hypothetical protein